VTTPLPRVTSDRICCPGCSQRAPFLAAGFPDWHLIDTRHGRLVCPAVWPPYVAGAPQPRRRRPIAHPLRRKK
jgi:hypothetical protein